MQNLVDLTAVHAAVDKLHQLLLLVPEGSWSHLGDIYPEFDNPDLSPSVFLSMVQKETDNVRTEISPQPENVYLLRTWVILLECTIDLLMAGVR